MLTGVLQSEGLVPISSLFRLGKARRCKSSDYGPFQRKTSPRRYGIYRRYSHRQSAKAQFMTTAFKMNENTFPRGVIRYLRQVLRRPSSRLRIHGQDENNPVGFITT